MGKIRSTGVFLLVAIVFFTALGTINWLIEKELNQACQDAEYNAFYNDPDTSIDMCEDKEGNLHYVKVVATGMLKREAKPITVGINRIQ